MTNYEKALQFATEAHGEQKRKYTGEPYINHPIAVANILKELDYTEDILIVALLHDVVEDTPITIEEIKNVFGDKVAILVDMVTDVYTSENFPFMNRAKRKAMECSRLEGISSIAKCVKLADLIDNTSSIVAHDPGFAKTYLKEKEEMLKILHGGDQQLMDRAVQILNESKLKLCLV